MNLLVITPKVDPADPLVGFVPGWLQALAARVARVEVLCLERAPADLPANLHVHSLGKERGAGKSAQAIAFYRLASRLRPDVVFCQFSPIFVLAVAPLAALRGWPIVLWYTHRHVDLKLRLASALAARVVTASPESYRLGGPKMRVIGHGIDPVRFSPAQTPDPLPAGPAGRTIQPGDESPGPPRRTILAVGRIAPIKHYDMLIEAAAQIAPARPGVDFAVAGGVQAPGLEGYFADLRDLAFARGLPHERFRFLGPVPHPDTPALYRAATLAVNLAPTGGLDKAVLEGLLCGVPTLVRNRSFAPLLADDAAYLLVPDGDTAQVTQRLTTLLDLPETERRALGLRMRERALAAHGLPGLADRLVQVFAEVARS